MTQAPGAHGQRSSGRVQKPISYDDFRGSSDEGEDDQEAVDIIPDAEQEVVDVVETEEEAELLDASGGYNSDDQETALVLMPGTPAAMIRPTAVASPSPQVFPNSHVFSPTEPASRLQQIRNQLTPSVHQSGSPLVGLLKARAKATQTPQASTCGGLLFSSPTLQVILERCDSPKTQPVMQEETRTETPEPFLQDEAEYDKFDALVAAAKEAEKRRKVSFVYNLI